MFGGKSRWGSRYQLGAAGRAGPRRLAIMGCGALSVVTLGIVALTHRTSAPDISADRSMQYLDPLPGGFQSTPMQDSVAFHADTKSADVAQRAGRSFTPPLSPSVHLVNGAPVSDPEPPRPAAPLPRPRYSAPTPAYPPPVVIPVAARIVVPAPDDALPKPKATPVQYNRSTDTSGNRDDAQQKAYDQQVKDLMDQWGPRPPHTDVILPPAQGQGDQSDRSAPSSPRTAAADLPGIRPASVRSDEGGRILVPAGRGIYAHPVLNLNSDTGGPAIFQADSGRIAGDRMIGSFTRQGNRLVIKIENVIHHGRPIGATGFVIAPGTMEAGVASDVDQNYLSRFILPAAAAFVQGLGSAIATTSNTAAVLSPLGGVTTSTNLNLNQQLGIAAGVAASNVGSSLNASAPKGPTVSLAAGVTVGVMFLTSVVDQSER